jgi:hypothetical protein
MSGARADTIHTTINRIFTDIQTVRSLIKVGSKDDITAKNLLLDAMNWFGLKCENPDFIVTHKSSIKEPLSSANFENSRPHQNFLKKYPTQKTWENAKNRAMMPWDFEGWPEQRPTGQITNFFQRNSTRRLKRSRNNRS